MYNIEFHYLDIQVNLLSKKVVTTINSLDIKKCKIYEKII